MASSPRRRIQLTDDEIETIYQLCLRSRRPNVGSLFLKIARLREKVDEMSADDTTDDAPAVLQSPGPDYTYTQQDVDTADLVTRERTGNEP
jgi:hypothetical protein